MKTYEDLNKDQEFYLGDLFTLERYRQFARHLSNHAKNVLDVGCHIGRGGKEIKSIRKDLTLYGLDCVQDFLNQIPTDVYSHKIYVESTLNIPLENSSIDAIVAGEFIEHLYPHDVDKTLREFFRLLKPGGSVLLTTPNPNYLVLKLTGKGVIGGPHVSEHYISNLTKQLKEIGFSQVKFLGSGKVSRILGENFPLLMMYGSYLAIASKE